MGLCAALSGFLGNEVVDAVLFLNLGIAFGRTGITCSNTSESTLEVSPPMTAAKEATRVLEVQH
jgi:hypothetical protein